jgi:hypothetical protein
MGLHLSREKIMANKRLTCHINTVSTGKHHVDVNVESQPKGAIRLNFQLTGDLEQIRIPAPQPPAAVDRLWEHTCFEVFIAAAGKANYHEFNFSPSGQWAAYAFSDYRMPDAWKAGQAPTINFTQTHEHLHLDVVIHTDDLHQNLAGKPLQLGLTAVIEANDGSRSYWALHHPEVHPDFHHRAGFILSLNPN